MGFGLEKRPERFMVEVEGATCARVAKTSDVSPTHCKNPPLRRIA